MDGKREPMNLGAFTAYVYRTKSPGDTLELTLLRRGVTTTLQDEVVSGVRLNWRINVSPSVQRPAPVGTPRSARKMISPRRMA